MKTQAIFGPYEPDKPAHLLNGLSDMGNAYAGANGYRPVGKFGAITVALPEKFSGGAAFIASDGTGTLIGGTTDGLYHYVSGAWTPYVTGLSLSIRWQFTQFGDVAIAVNGSTTREVNLVSGAISNVPDAPTARSVATVRDFVVYGQAGGNAAMVQWSAFGNQDGNTPDVDQAGFQPMLTGGSVQGIAGGEYGVIIQRSRVVRMTYTGDADDPWQFDEISANIGAITGSSIVQAGRTIFFLSDRGFMMCDGNTVTPIGNERVDRTFFAAYQRASLDLMSAAIDPRRNVVAWAMPGTPGMMLLYDWALDRWAKIRFGLAAVFSGFSANVTLEALDALYPGGIDTIPYSLDDGRFAGGDPLFLVVDRTNAIGTLSGDNMPAYFTCPFQEYVQGGVARLRTVRPLSDVLDGITVTLDSRARLGDPAYTSTASTLTGTGLMPVRSSGRYIAPRIDLADSATWTYLQGIELDVSSGGAR